ncbi:MAG: hypothetical protein HDR56_00705 [Treponema sp.]|nr:hypothetical protein [Treponema sp.]MBD5406124.1 hypothetical protein [Treponema sp.]
MINLENTSTISSILKDLTSVHENLLLLSNDIWISIDHNDSEKLEECYQFKKEFNQLLDIFEKNKDSICTLVSQFTGVKVEEQPKTIEKDAAENERLIKKLDKNTPHEITEDFTFKRPTAFVFNGYVYYELNTWIELYIQFVATVAKINPEKLKDMAKKSDFISKQNRKYYSADKKDLRKAKKIMDDFFVETNLSANEFAKRICEIMNYLELKTSDITIYLRQDRNT